MHYVWSFLFVEFAACNAALFFRVLSWIHLLKMTKQTQTWVLLTEEPTSEETVLQKESFGLKEQLLLEN